jgi:predicted metal-binding membrane protein
MCDNPLEAVLRRERLIVVAALGATAALAWAYIVWLASGMSKGGNMGAMLAPKQTGWAAADFVFAFLMWTAMMVGMMAPSVAPMILLYDAIGRRAVARGSPFASTASFAFGYFLSWTVFALAAALAQGALLHAALLTPMLTTVSSAFAGAVLIAAGLLQWSPLKDACLSQCQSPLHFIQRHGGFRSAWPDSLRLGLLHGLYCIGCCWALMSALFAVGVMNILWIAALAILVLLEKTVPGRTVPRIAGMALVAVGLWMLFGGALAI